MLVVLVALVAQSSALMAGTVVPRVMQRAATPQMACNGGKGGRGGEGPPLDKMRRGKMGALIQAADSAEKVKAILLSSQTEQILLKVCALPWPSMHLRNWRSLASAPCSR